MFRNLVLSAAAAGLAAGLLTAALQHVTTTPIILAAELYEVGAADGDDGPSAAPVVDLDVAAAEGAREEPAWAPTEGLERAAYTSLSTVVTGMGFALVLLAAMSLSNQRIQGPRGLAFGIAGFAAISLAPALGLPPDLPGSAAAGLADRQAWWLFAALSSAGGLASLFLGGHRAFRVAGVFLIAVPHVVGAPQPQAFASTAPAELAGHFAAASLAVSAVFWAVLGYASGSVYERLARAE